MEMCAICFKRKAEHKHHLINGRGMRPLADADNIYLNICGECHEHIHHNGVAQDLSQMLGQMMWEEEWMLCIRQRLCTNGELRKDAREAFMERYGRNYL